MNVRQAIFVSVASAGVVASSWFGGPTATAQTSTPPAHVRLGAAHLGAATAASGPGTTTPTRTTAAVAGSGPAATARRRGPVVLSPLGRGQLRSGAALQLVSSPAYPAAAYPSTLQAVVDRAHR